MNSEPVDYEVDREHSEPPWEECPNCVGHGGDLDDDGNHVPCDWCDETGFLCSECGEPWDTEHVCKPECPVCHELEGTGKLCKKCGAPWTEEHVCELMASWNGGSGECGDLSIPEDVDGVFVFLGSFCDKCGAPWSEDHECAPLECTETDCMCCREDCVICRKCGSSWDEDHECGG